MLSQWLQQARNGRSVWLSDVRRGCEALPEHVAVTVQLTLCDGARRDFSLPIPRWANGEQRQFVQQYVTAFVFNALSALSGREMAFYLDLRETEVVALLGELDDIFQVHKTARSGYGKVVNIANRLCRAFGGGTFSFAVRDRSAYVPAPPEVSRGGDLLPRLRRSVERCGSGVYCGIDIGGTDIKAAVAVDGRLVCVKEYDWNPAASLVAEGITGPIVLLVQLMACCAAGMTPALQAALDKDASDEEMTRAVAQSASVPLDVLGVSFPDVVIRDRIVGGESPKTKGMRENPAIDYETAFAGLGGLVDQLRPLCREGAALHMTNDGHIAAFTAAAERRISAAASSPTRWAPTSAWAIWTATAASRRCRWSCTTFCWIWAAFPSGSCRRRICAPPATKTLGCPARGGIWGRRRPSGWPMTPIRRCWRALSRSGTASSPSVRLRRTCASPVLPT